MLRFLQVSLYRWVNHKVQVCLCQNHQAFLHQSLHMSQQAHQFLSQRQWAHPLQCLHQNQQAHLLQYQLQSQQAHQFQNQSQLLHQHSWVPLKAQVLQQVFQHHWVLQQVFQPLPHWVPQNQLLKWKILSTNVVAKRFLRLVKKTHHCQWHLVLWQLQLVLDFLPNVRKMKNKTKIIRISGL